jgi:hypothetical protein
MNVNQRLEASVLELIIVFGGCYGAGWLAKLHVWGSVVAVMGLVILTLFTLLRRSQRG